MAKNGKNGKNGNGALEQAFAADVGFGFEEVTKGVALSESFRRIQTMYEQPCGIRTPAWSC